MHQMLMHKLRSICKITVLMMLHTKFIEEKIKKKFLPQIKKGFLNSNEIEEEDYNH